MLGQQKPLIAASNLLEDVSIMLQHFSDKIKNIPIKIDRVSTYTDIG
jgi:hypothetical protein